MKIRNDKINYGFEDMNGNIWPNSWVDSYNRFNEILEKYKKIPENELSPLTRNEMNFYLDQRHKLFVMFLDIFENERKINEK